jgi:hypothetical protein
MSAIDLSLYFKTIIVFVIKDTITVKKQAINGKQELSATKEKVVVADEVRMPKR